MTIKICVECKHCWPHPTEQYICTHPSAVKSVSNVTGQKKYLNCDLFRNDPYIRWINGKEPCGINAKYYEPISKNM